MSPLLVTILITLIAWFWSNNMRARERALELSAKACQTTGLQLLDQTVALSRIGIGREANGRLSLQRVYNFEFTQDGQHRRQGKIAMQGLTVKAIHLDHPDGPIIMQPDQLT